jgi:sialic acid synthase SpsE
MVEILVTSSRHLLFQKLESIMVGDIKRAIQMINDVADAGGECVKFQAHSVDDEMIPNDVVPANSTRSIWDIIAQCTLTNDEELACKKHAEDRGLFFLSTPFHEKQLRDSTHWMFLHLRSAQENAITLH